MRPCRKDDPNWPWLCNCDECSRSAATAWTSTMQRVLDGEITLAEANAIQDGVV